MVQSNSIGDAFKGAFGINPLFVGIAVAILAAFIFLGGIGRIASVTEKLVPIMAGFYIIGALVLIIMNIGNLPNVIRMIFVGAFNPEAAIGGFGRRSSISGYQIRCCPWSVLQRSWYGFHSTCTRSSKSKTSLVTRVW